MLSNVQLKVNQEASYKLDVINLYAAQQRERGLISEFLLARKALFETYDCFRLTGDHGPSFFASCWQKNESQKVYARMIADTDEAAKLLQRALLLLEERINKSAVEIAASYRKERTHALIALANLYVQSARSCEAISYFQAAVIEVSDKRVPKKDIHSYEKFLSDSMKQCAYDENDVVQQRNFCRSHSEKYYARLSEDLNLASTENRHKYVQILANQLDCMYLIADTKSMKTLKENFIEFGRESELFTFIRLAKRVYPKVRQSGPTKDAIVNSLLYIADKLGR